VLQDLFAGRRSTSPMSDARHVTPTAFRRLTDWRDADPDRPVA
jgi:hypothetical protein